MPGDEYDDLLDSILPKTNPRDRVHSIASKVGISPDIADDYYRLTNVESGHNVNVRDSSKGAQGFGQVMPDQPGGTTRTVGGKRYNLRDPNQNIEAGLKYFAEGGSDPVGRRLYYFGGPGAKQHYDRTGQIPNISDGNMTAAQYVKATGGLSPSRPPKRDEYDDLIDEVAGSKADSYDSLLNEVAQPAQADPVVRSRLGTNAPVQRGPVRGSRKPIDPFAGVKAGAEAQHPMSVGELRRSEDVPIGFSRTGQPSRVTQTADELRVMKGEQPADRIAYSRQQDAQARLSQMRELGNDFDPKKEAQWRAANEPAIQQETQKYKQDIQQAKAAGGDPGQWLAEFGTKAAAGLAELGAGAGSDTLRIKAEAAMRAAQEEGADRNVVSKFVQDVGAGFISSAPELAAMSLGASPVAAFGVGGALRAGGSGRDPVAGAVHGAGTGLAFEVPGIGEGAKRILTKAGAVGAASTGLELATGATPREALTTGATNALLVGAPEFIHLQFGKVKAVEDQARVPRGSVRVVDEAGAEHVIRKPNLRGAGNERAIPIKPEPTAPAAEAAPAEMPPESIQKETAPQAQSTVSPALAKEVRPVDDLKTGLVKAPTGREEVIQTSKSATRGEPNAVEKAVAPANLQNQIIVDEKGAGGQGTPETVMPPAPSIRRSKNRGSTLVTGERSDISLSQFVRKRGGIAPGSMFRGELERISNKETGSTGLVNQNARSQGGRKMTADMMMEAANEAGFGPYENAGDFLYDVGRDATGDKIQALVGDEVNFDKEYRKHAERDIADEKERRSAQQSADRLFTLIESGRGGDLFDKIRDNNATPAEQQELRSLARKSFVRTRELEDLIDEAKTEGGAVSFESIPKTPSTEPRQRAEQLGFTQEGLTQESAPPPKEPDQRARLVSEEQARQRTANPERAAAMDTLAELRRKGMTVDDYAKQGSLIGEAPSRTKLQLLRELERGDKPAEASQPTLTRQAGAIDVDLLTLGVRPFAKDVASRGREVVAGTREIADGIKSLLAPPSRSQQAQQTSRVVRANAAEMARAHDIADKSLEGARKHFAAQKPEANYEFIDRMERGQPQPDPKTQQFADTLRQLLDERRDQVRALGTGKLESFITDYFPHIWKDPKKARDAFMGAFSKRPLEGSKAFLKPRTLPLTSDGLKLKLEPVSNNPVDLATLKLREMDKYIMAHKVMGEMKDQGNLKFFKVSERIPDGWKEINDRVATVFSRSEKGELVLRGRFAAPEPAAKIINNYLSPGLNATAWRTPFKAWRATANVLNQFQLGFSAFHAGFTTVDAVVSRTAAGLEDILRHGKIARGAATIASTPISPLTNLVQGSKMLKEWYSPGSQGAEIGKLIDSMVQAGGRARMDRFYTNETSKKLMDTLRQGNILGAAIRAPGATVELLSKPVMEWLVPRQKMGVFADLAKRELERLGPNATQAQTRHAMAKAWDSVDNRMGQLVYDNLFWNKTTKDLAMASVRSVGWNIGTIRELGGGLVDYAGLPKRAIQKVRGRNPDPLFTSRMAYTTALPLVVGTMGAMTQYLMTGKGPEELKDYFFPKTGALDENGNPERISFPSYMKDVFHAAEEPLKVVTNKLHPLIGIIAETLRNEDYYGTKIRNEDDPYVQQLLDVAKHIGEAALPFSVRGYQKETERGGSMTKRVLPFVGITPAPSFLNKSPAEKVISEKVQAAMPKGSRTREQADRSRLRHDLQSKARRGEDITPEVNNAIQQSKLKPDDAHDILRDAKQSPLQLRYKRLPLKDALEVWDVMTTDERADVKDILAKKAESVGDLPLNEQEEVKGKLDSIGLRDTRRPQRPKRPERSARPSRVQAGYVFQ